MKGLKQSLLKFPNPFKKVYPKLFEAIQSVLLDCSNSFFQKTIKNSEKIS